MSPRLAKAIMCFCLAAFALLVAADNVIDYDTNYAFVRHVFSMDTTFPGNALMGRAITNPKIWALGYAGIIAGEALCGLLFLLAGLLMLGSPASVGRGKRCATAAAVVGFLVWFFGFMVVGGEWFQMWQSQTWNGQQAAFRFYVTILAVLIFVHQPER